MLRRLLLACLFALATQDGHAAPGRNFTIGGWTGGVYTGRSGEFTHCAASFLYEADITVIFSVNRNYNWAMGLFRPGADLMDGARVDLILAIDADPPFAVRGIARGNDLVEINFADGSSFARLLRGHRIKVTEGKRVATFELSNISDVLPALVNCVTSQLNAGQNRPAARAGLQPSKDANRAEATRFAANLLSLAGITGFSLLEPDMLDELKADAAWRSGNVLGTVLVAPELTATQVPSLVIGTDAKTCKGAFFSGSLPDEGNIAARVFTTCQTGKDNLTVYYLSVPRRAGGIYLIAIASTEGEQPAKEIDADIRKAVYRLR